MPSSTDEGAWALYLRICRPWSARPTLGTLIRMTHPWQPQWRPRSGPIPVPCSAPMAHNILPWDMHTCPNACGCIRKTQTLFPEHCVMVYLSWYICITLMCATGGSRSPPRPVGCSGYVRRTVAYCTVMCATRGPTRPRQAISSKLWWHNHVISSPTYATHT